MQVISIILLLVTLLASFALFASFVMLLSKRWRKRGVKTLVISLLTIILAVPASMFLSNKAAQQAGFENLSDQQRAKNNGYTSATEWVKVRDELLAKHRAELKAQATARQEKMLEAEQAAADLAALQEQERVDALAGFPDEATKDLADAKGIKRYEAYKLLSDQGAIKQYCDYRNNSGALSEARSKDEDSAKSDEQRRAISDQYERMQEDLLAALKKSVGLQRFEIYQIENAGHWIMHCRAAEMKRTVVTEQNAKSASRSDANEAKDALTAFYLFNLNNETSPFFSKQRYSAASCNWENYGDMRFVGCQLKSLSYQSNWQMFLVARSEDGKLAVYPINGDTSEKLTNAGARFIDNDYNGRIFVQAYTEPRAYISQYVGPRIDISGVRNLFE